jgi:hypothetical protein
VVAHAVPDEGAVMERDGQRWTAINSLGRLQPLPGHLAKVLAGQCTPGPLPAQLVQPRVELA